MASCDKNIFLQNQDINMSQNSTVSTDKSVPQPSFINDSNGLKLINDFNLSVSDLQLYAKKSFALFAIDRFVFRYNIASNMIDTIVDLGEIEGFKHHEISCAADGRYLISYFYYTDSKNDELITENYYLIDLEQQNSIFLADTFSEKNSEIARKKIPEELQMEFYNLSFYDEELKSDRIAESKCVSSIFKKFNGRHIWNSLVDLETLIVICPKEIEYCNYFWDYTLLVIDLNKDSVIKNFPFSDKTKQ